MSSLVNQKIKDTYEGLIKTSDEQPIDGTLKNLQDGNGGVLPIQVSTSTINFTGTVTGIDAGGMVAGTGTDSIKSADALTTNAATASANDTIAIGNGASATSGSNIAIGENADAGGDDFFDRVNIAIGKNTVANNERCIAIGLGTDATGARAIAMGEDAQAQGSGSIAIGQQAEALGGLGIAIGKGANASAAGEVMAIGLDADCNGNAGTMVVGRDTFADGLGALAVGRDADAGGTDSVAVGRSAETTQGFSTAVGPGTDVTAEKATALGYNAQATAQGAVALGEVTAGTVDTTTLKLLQIANYASMNFADDTAAATGGIPLGGVYHTSGALKIRIA